MEGRIDNQILGVRVKEAISQWKRRKMHWMVVKVGWENIASASTNLCSFTVHINNKKDIIKYLLRRHLYKNMFTLHLLVDRCHKWLNIYEDL